MYRNPAFKRGFFFGIHILIALIRNGFESEDPSSAPPIGIRKLLCKKIGLKISRFFLTSNHVLVDRLCDYDC